MLSPRSSLIFLILSLSLSYPYTLCTCSTRPFALHNRSCSYGEHINHECRRTSVIRRPRLQDEGNPISGLKREFHDLSTIEKRRLDDPEPHPRKDVVSREGRPGGRVARKWERRRWRRTNRPTRRQEDAVVAADDDRLLHKPLLLLPPAAATSNPNKKKSCRFNRCNTRGKQNI